MVVYMLYYKLIKKRTEKKILFFGKRVFFMFLLFLSIHTHIHTLLLLPKGAF